MKRKMAAIVSADVAGYSRLVALDEEGTLHRFGAYREVFDSIIHHHGGRIFNTAGDSVMSEFGSAVDAVRASVDIQTVLRAENASLPPDRRVEFRIGITIGDVVERDGDLLGDDVNIAARLQGLAAPGGICVSRTVHEATAAKISIGFHDVGPQNLKHIPGPVHAFMVAWPGEPAPHTSEVRAERRAPRSARGEGYSGDDADGIEDRRERRSRRERQPLWMRLRWVLIVLLIVMVVVPTLRLVRRSIEKFGGLASVEEMERVPTRGQAGSKPADPAAIDATVAPRADKQAVKPDTKGNSKTDSKADTTQSQSTEDAGGQAKTPSDKTPPDKAPPEKPAKPLALPELYQSARTAEAKGDTAAAKRAYAELARRAGDYIDAPMRYAALLRAQEGRASARDAFAALATGNNSKAVQLTYAQQLPQAERRGRIEALANQNPGFIPAWYALAQLYGSDSEGKADEGARAPTLTDRRLEYDALDRVLTADAEGKLAPFFLDQTMRREWVENALRRKKALQARFENGETRPKASFRRGENGWIASVALPEPATAVSYRLGENGEFVPVGAAGADAATRKPVTAASFTLPLSLPRSSIYIAYQDLSGRTAGPFAIAFDPGQALAASQRQVLDLASNSWLDWAADRDLLFFNQLVSYRCALRGAAIGFDGQPPTTPLPLPPCDETNPYAVPPDARVSVPIPPGARSVSIVLTYADGSRSAIRTFERPVTGDTAETVEP